MTAPTRLISPAELLPRLGGPDLALVEVSFSRSDESFRRGHIPGAVWAYWKDLLWDPVLRSFPSAATLASRLGRIGIRGEQLLVLYGDPLQFGAYALWVLAALGQRKLRYLDGGKEHWLGAGLPLASGPAASSSSPPRPYGAEDRGSMAGRDEVLRALEARSHAILDFRSPEEFAGARVSPLDMPGGVDHGAERSGRIPTARHLHHRELLRDDWTLRPEAELLASLAARGVALDDPIIGYCRLSHRASLGWLALTGIGATDVRVYDGSWTEWGSMVGMPIER